MPRALLSVSDKAGLAELARGLAAAGWELVATGGTARALLAEGLAVTEVAALTGFPEMLDGRVKTLHPAVHGGILARRGDAGHMAALAEHGIGGIDAVVVNLYPFAETARRPGVSAADLVEQIDIGGVSLLRSAAKNHADVTVLCDPADYAVVLAEVREAGATSPGTRRRLAIKAFEHTAAYDVAIARTLPGVLGVERGDAPLLVAAPAVQALRYGENPHQGAGYHADPFADETSLVRARQLQGKELSYNNLLDGDGALEAVRDLAGLAAGSCVIVKHGNPCGMAVGPTAAEAFERALACDPDAAFGGIAALGCPVDGTTARLAAGIFMEVVIAPSFDEEARSVLAQKKNLRVLETGAFVPQRAMRLVRSIVGGYLVVDRDLGTARRDEMRVATSVAPDEETMAGLLFSWLCVKWVKSNAVVYTDGRATIGIGAGQMARIDSARFGAMKARQGLAGALMASDGFFPFRDSVDHAAAQGIRAIIQPGGSMRDAEVIAAANEHGIPMVLTGRRHFRH